MRPAVAVLLAAVPALLALQDPSPPPAVLQRAQALGQPTAQHALLQRLAGEWDVVLRTTPPGGSEQTDRGRVVAAPILGGRYVVANFTLELRGAKVEAVQILGFDTLRQLWSASWRDSLSTWAVDGSGPLVAEPPGVVELRGTLADARDPTGRPFRQVVDLRAEKAVKVRLFETHGDQEFEVQVQEWTRR